MTLHIFWKIFLISSFLMGCTHISDKSREQAARQTRLQLGLEYLKQGDYKAARQNFEKALLENEEDYRAQLGMALYEQNVGENKAAHQRYQKILKLAPLNATVMNHYGTFLCKQGDYASAQEQFSAAVLSTDYIEIADNLENAGYCFFEAKQYKFAQMLISRALKYDSEKGRFLIEKAKKQFEFKKYDHAQFLLNVHQSVLPVCAEVLLLQIYLSYKFGDEDSVQNIGKQLARDFSHSKEYKDYLAHED
ncbi:type IV pilus biogenesis/stability protein PilW [Candidatus Hamiltonella defensa]|uniref:type IV pilus biogenesis/stability protein PilW n=1 Tax=Candidatus Williamhamiltonella defendens TaxID=138072 RepID=UPI000C1E6155|nr:type IV pilus biogenesis/stability protein PilW [Candidatus Hamiltonella defensa]ATW31921.1 type IV pilus biogenesis/stability protein PilW [Candidatus Hamiltonella defensa]